MGFIDFLKTKCSKQEKRVEIDSEQSIKKGGNIYKLYSGCSSYCVISETREKRNSLFGALDYYGCIQEDKTVDYHHCIGEGFAASVHTDDMIAAYFNRENEKFSQDQIEFRDNSVKGGLLRINEKGAYVPVGTWVVWSSVRDEKDSIRSHALCLVYFMTHPEFQQAIYRLWNSLSQEIKTAIKGILQDYFKSNNFERVFINFDRVFVNFDGEKGEELLVSEFYVYFKEQHLLRVNRKYAKDFERLELSLLDFERDFSEDIRHYFGMPPSK